MTCGFDASLFVKVLMAFQIEQESFSEATKFSIFFLKHMIKMSLCERKKIKNNTYGKQK